VTKPRVQETTTGIQGEFDVQAYDQMMRTLRDRGWIETDLLIKSGMTSGHALEIGPGPGYLGLEWLKKTIGTCLTGVDISPGMIALAEKNAREYDLLERVTYSLGDARALPFPDGEFDAVFSNGSLHEWEDPGTILGEAYRVLRRGGRLLVSDLRRDMLPPEKLFLWIMTKPKAMRQGLLTSIASSYTPQEVRALLLSANLEGWGVKGNALGLVIRAQKRDRPGWSEDLSA
jgi:ubiquinone/menaquinone biosynthesis C-methylase UbiE